MNKTNRLPVLATKGVISFPGFPVTVEVSRKASLAAIAASDNKYIILTSLKDIKGPLSPANTHKVGVLAKITKKTTAKDGTLEVTTLELIAQERVNLTDIKITKGYLSTLVTQFKTVHGNSANVAKYHKAIVVKFKDQISTLGSLIPKDALKPFLNASTEEIVDALSYWLPLDYKIKMEILAQPSLEKRMKQLLVILTDVTKQVDNATEVTDEVMTKVKTKLNKQQKEFYLREQLKVVQDELDDITGEISDASGYRNKAESNPYPEDIKKILRKEIRKFENTPSSAAESNVTRTYIETLLELPFWQTADEAVDIKKSKTMLDKNHFGLKKVKERIIEQIAVLQNNPEAKSPILSLVGPPGTGKTSLAYSIAKGLNRPLVKVSLGGVRDESEIRGHRRTYIASMPGKIIQAVIKSGVNNPIILLDELDKMSSDFRGDPAAAMLEVLDYEQNKHFQDHYIEAEYDLSKVMFIATANYADRIPEALYDRLEIIEINSYTELEKLEIAKRHLLPKVYKELNLSKSSYKISDVMILHLIKHYTIESGVRQLNRVLESIGRKIIVNKLDKKIKIGVINEKQIVKLLGQKIFDFTDRDIKPQVGTVMGLAWTGYGGDVLPIEVTLFEGKGDLKLTGQQKDVMQESAAIALSYIKTNKVKFGIPKKINGIEVFKDLDIHVHVPDGATPKDGPSAGVTFTTALLSALLNKPVSQFIAMTGEVTLRGHVLPIGGLKEKTLSAKRSGLKTIFIPKKNEKDLKDLPKEVKDSLEFIIVDDYSKIFNYIFK